MSRVPSGPPGPGGHGLPPMYYPGGGPGMPPHPPPQGAPPPPQLYIDPYASYRGVPPASPFGPDGGYNAAAGPSRDPYSTPTSARSVSGPGGIIRGDPSMAAAFKGQPVPPQAEPPSRHASWHKNDVFDQNGKEITSGHSTQQAGPSEFIKKLYKMLEDESAQYGRGKPVGAPRSKGERGSVGWGRGGTSFVVWDMNEFTTKILPQTFRHSNFSSFVRQLNKYGFSKIKHVDEETGQIKENVWEFQHPSFQAGGKADLDSIKRKAVVPKKAATEEAEASPARVLSNEDQSRMMDMLNRIVGLEDALFKTQEELHKARNREGLVLSVVRELVSHLSTGGQDLPGEESVARMRRLSMVLDHASTGLPPPPQGFGAGVPGVPTGVPGGLASAVPGPGSVPPPPSGDYQQFGRPMAYNPVSNFTPMAPLTSPLQAGQPPSAQAPPSHVSPRPDGSRASNERQSPSLSRQKVGSNTGGQRRDRQPKDEPRDMAQQQQSQQMMMSENGQWMPDTPNGAARTSLRFMVDPMPAGGASVASLEDTSMDATSAASAAAVAATGVSAAAASVAAAAAAAEADANQPQVMQQQQQQQQQQNATGSTTTGQTNANGTPLRQVVRRTPKPSWTQTPRILVVEDDVVYRQLSSKFLEKFGCVVETAENAQQGVEKMNQTKFDLVLMDIFFGPSMDGRKATSLIRQFDMYTPIISMTSNVQTKDVDSYIQSGMNDVLAKPFTKQHLFCILDKHLIHLKAIQLSAEVPRFLGVPPLSDQGVVDAITTTAQQWENGSAELDSLGNPLAGSGWSDETYRIVLQQFLTTGAIPDQSSVASSSATISALGMFPDTTGFSRKRTIEAVGIDEDWEQEAKKHQPLPVGTVTELA